MKYSADEVKAYLKMPVNFSQTDSLAFFPSTSLSAIYET
jgi:hypothetical protein